MKKLLTLFISSFLLMTACNAEENTSPGSLNVRFDETKIVTTVDGVRVDFNVYLERPDLQMRQPDNNGEVYTSDLPVALQPKLFYISSPDDTEPQSGNMCDRPRFPHLCSVDLKDASAKSSNYLLKVTFEDGGYAEKLITVDHPDQLDIPALQAPKFVPEQGSTLAMVFADVAAGEYKITVENCNKYKNDGIDPCLESVTYRLKREGDKLVSDLEDEYYEPKVVITEGEIHLSSDFELYFGENVVYSITATKHLEGKKTTLESSSLKILTLDDVAPPEEEFTDSGSIEDSSTTEELPV